ncbi:MAG: hypothetical protein IJW21_06990, partial [Clostridia bacterium]|nr:hypothetical protein [Clostridia bacterium]
NKVTFREKGKLYEIISGRDMVRLVVNGEATHVLPLPKGRITQNYIAGQNLVYEGNIYYIDAIDKKAGKIFVDLATAGENKENYKYIQSRYYTFDCSEETLEHTYIPRHGFIDKSKDDICVDEAFISVFRAPAEVLTKGYYVVDPHTMNENDPEMRYYSISDSGNDTLAKQTYRKYGDFKKPTYSNESMMYDEYKSAVGKGALAMSIRLTGKFGEDVRRTAALAGVMLSEIIREMFPSVADSVAVCPVFAGELPEDDVLRTQPKLKLIGAQERNAEDFELWIIEDSDIDLGVVSVLMTSGNDVLKDIFEPMLAYLRWYTGKEGGKSEYLHYGMDHEPECFDFKSLLGLSEILGESSLKNKFKEVADVIEYETCDFCGCRRVKGTGMVMLEDGRRMCSDCAKSVVGNNAKALKSYLDRAKIFLESTYGITLDEHYEFCFESTLKIVNTIRQNRELAIRGSDIPLKGYVQGKKAVAEFGIPSAGFSELLVRELTYIWQIKNIPNIDPELAEGHIALVAVQYLRFLRQQSIADMRANYYESTENTSGEGYRRLVSALLKNTQYNNNPFYYLLEISGGDSEEQIKRPTRRTKTKGDYGKRYTPEEDDRRKDGEVSYFYYDRLNADEQKVYTDVLHAIENHDINLTVEGFEFEDVSRIVKCVTYYRPTLFQYRTFSMLGTEITFKYGSTAEESTELMARIEEAAAKYLEDIDDTMSAYDTALRLHDKIVVSVDYDTIALEKEHEQNGPPTDKIDYLRSICGVFLNGKAVCEGYARAYQYLLQKCGIECAECAGYILKENGEQGGGHAWNLLKLDGDYYYADPTWDDASNTVQTVKDMDIGFKYFCITTDEILRSRDLALSPAEFPEYTATKCNYYYHNDLVLEEYNLDRIKEMAVATVKANKFDLRFKCTKKKVLDEAMNALFGENAEYDDVIKVAAKVKKNISGITYTWDNTIYTITITFKTK